MYKTFKYRLYPNATQEKKMENILDVCCALYKQLRYFLIQEYRNKEKSYSKYDKYAVVDKWRRNNDFVGQLRHRVARHVAERLHEAYQGFFRKDNGFPKPPNRKYFNSFGVTNWQLCKILKEEKQGKTKITDIGKITTRFHRELKGEPKKWEIIKKPSGKWYVCFTCEIKQNNRFAFTEKEVGIDVGISSFATTSKGKKYDKMKPLVENEGKLKTLNKELARRKKGSNRWNETKNKLAKLHEKIANQRRHMHYNIALDLLRKYDVIYIENLKIENMVKNRHLSKAIIDSSWGNFKTILKQKAELNGKQIIGVDPRNTSQVCSACGQIVKKDLSERTHKCDCGFEADRDVNAAINIMHRGQKQDISA